MKLAVMSANDSFIKCAHATNGNSWIEIARIGIFRQNVGCFYTIHDAIHERLKNHRQQLCAHQKAANSKANRIYDGQMIVDAHNK